MVEVQVPSPLPKSQPFFGRRHSTILKLWSRPTLRRQFAHTAGKTLLPHPSGASPWHKIPPGRVLTQHAPKPSQSWDQAAKKEGWERDHSAKEPVEPSFKKS